MNNGNKGETVSDEFKIQLCIDDFDFSLTCKRKHEYTIRKAARAVNGKLFEINSEYAEAHFSKKQLLSLAALELSVNALQIKNEVDTTPYFERIEALNKELEDYLQSLK